MTAPPEDRYELGRRTYERLSGRSDLPLGPVGELAPHFTRLTMEMFGDVWAREEQLDLRSRAIATVAMLAALGREPQLAVHIANARHVGLTREELVELMTQVAIYAGWPAAVTGLATAADVFAAEDGDSPSEGAP
jgi:4-carboxymuconolactone decarboxylase